MIENNNLFKKMATYDLLISLMDKMVRKSSMMEPLIKADNHNNNLYSRKMIGYVASEQILRYKYISFVVQTSNRT